MILASTEANGYDPVARAAHWHRSLGLTVLMAMLFRIGWLRLHPAPPLPSSVADAERILARGTHSILYLLFIVMPLVGYVNAAAGRAMRSASSGSSRYRR